MHSMLNILIELREKSVGNSNIVIPGRDTSVQIIKLLHYLCLFISLFPLDLAPTHKYITRIAQCVLCYRNTSETNKHTQ